jgi:hypothetical protein
MGLLNIAFSGALGVGTQFLADGFSGVEGFVDDGFDFRGASAVPARFPGSLPG